MIDLLSINPHFNPYWDDVAEYYRVEQYRRYGRPANPQQRFAREVEQKITQRIGALGYSVWPTPNNSPFDLWAGGARIEVKGSTWQESKHRYQAAVRNWSADLLIFDAINGTDHIFIIPLTLIFPKRTVEICSYDVTRYSGQWADYLENWGLLHEVIALAPPHPVQLELWPCPDTTTSFRM